jgi:hypothetical protein
MANLLLRDCDSCGGHHDEMPIVEGVCESCDFKCPHCPCHWVAIANHAFDFVEHTFAHDNIAFPDGRNGETGRIHPCEVRFALYQEYIQLYYGVLGHGIHCDPPQCVKEAIYKEYPNPDKEKCIGFCHNHKNRN